ncbi:1616_t:CDS:2 [Funneliformis caledonium]|uniref:1616_t:CDS:1 n=2 Tax=Funneliformis TaxID=1117308 RepID=A0A9N8YNR8_9GLOM|nr:1616_t:CDS:2 [Funneliformis caledonium]CAG8454817.1 15201_t:CDS:2 [Funneliformis mosseae]
MSLGNRASDFAHRTLVIALAGIAVYSFVGAGVMINRRLDKSKEMYMRQELQKFSQDTSQNSESIVTDDNV